jgi:hypothetical protein
MFPRSFIATERYLLKLHLTFIVFVLHLTVSMYVPCILCSLLFRPTNTLYILKIHFYTVSTPMCFDAFALCNGSNILYLLKYKTSNVIKSMD